MPNSTFEESERRRAERRKVLMAVFPGDPKIANALSFGEGVCDQLGPLADALRKDIRACYSAEATKAGFNLTALEDKLMQSVADVLAWHTQLELALHDIRAALFFRFNNRLKAAPDPEEAERAETRAKFKAQAAPGGGVTTPPGPPPPPPQAPPPETPLPVSPAVEERVLEKLGNLFENLHGSP